MNHTLSKGIPERFTTAPVTDSDFVLPAVPESSASADDRINPVSIPQFLHFDLKPKAGNDRTSSGYIYGNAGISFAVYREYEGSWTYWLNGPLVSGVTDHGTYYTVGIFTEAGLCNSIHLPWQFITSVNLYLSGTVGQYYSVWTNQGYVPVPGNNNSYVQYAADGTYTVPLSRIVSMGYTDFVISLANTGGYADFSPSVTIEYTTAPVTAIQYGYDSLSEQVFDIAFPSSYTVSGGLTSAVILLHGGSWGEDGVTRSQMNPLINYVLNTGRICVNMEYRQIMNNNTPSCSNMLDDIKTLIKYLKDHYSAFLDTSKIALMGYSAGGHLALLFSYRHGNSSGNDPGAIPVTLVISVAGPTDLTSSPDNYLFLTLRGNESAEDISPLRWPFPCDIATSLFYSINDGLISYSEHGAPMLQKSGLTSVDMYTMTSMDHFTVLTDVYTDSSARSTWQAAITLYD